MIQCWNCEEFFEQGLDFCPKCEQENNLKATVVVNGEEEREEECCETCVFFELDNPINCPRLARKLKWDRDTFEIDEPSAFKCGDYSNGC